MSKCRLSLSVKPVSQLKQPGSLLILDSTGLKVYGKDEWHPVKHGVEPNHTFRKLHLAIDEHHQIIAHELTDKSVGDPSAVDSLLEQADVFDTLMADGSYDGSPVYHKILNKNPGASIVIPPPKNAVESPKHYPQSNAHTRMLQDKGRRA